MKRRDLVRHMVDHGCELVREGGNSGYQALVSLTKGENKAMQWAPRFREVLRRIASRPGFPT